MVTGGVGYSSTCSVHVISRPTPVGLLGAQVRDSICQLAFAQDYSLLRGVTDWWGSIAGLPTVNSFYPGDLEKNEIRVIMVPLNSLKSRHHGCLHLKLEVNGKN